MCWSRHSWVHAATYLYPGHPALDLPFPLGDGLGLRAVPAAIISSFLYSSSWKQTVHIKKKHPLFQSAPTCSSCFLFGWKRLVAKAFWHWCITAYSCIATPCPHTNAQTQAHTHPSSSNWTVCTPRMKTQQYTLGSSHCMQCNFQSLHL